MNLDIPTTAWIWKNFLKRKNLCLWFLIMMYLPGIHSAHRIYVQINVFHKLGKFFFFISSNVISAPFCFFSSSETPIISVLVHLMVCNRSLHLYSFSFIFFFLPLRLRNLNWIVFTFSDYSDSSYLLLRPSSELFIISVIVLFNSRISIWLFFLR